MALDCASDDASWTGVTVGHADMAGMTGTPGSGCPSFLADDGGIERTANCGASARNDRAAAEGSGAGSRRSEAEVARPELCLAWRPELGTIPCVMPCHSRPTLSLLAATLAVTVASSSCKDEETQRKLDDVTSRLEMCEKNLATARNDTRSCEKKLVEVAAKAPDQIQLNDPEFIKLIPDIRAAKRSSGSGDGPSLDPNQASKVVLGGAGAMQQCYERALKNNAGLQMQAGLTVRLHLTVKPTGGVESVRMEPEVDKSMTECVRSTAMRWKFPAFSGSSVDIEQKVILTPKT
jgi:hypothetical protein